MNYHKEVITWLGNLAEEDGDELQWRRICLNLASKHPRDFLELVGVDLITKDERALSMVEALIREHGPSYKVKAIKLHRDICKSSLAVSTELVTSIIKQIYPTER